MDEFVPVAELTETERAVRAAFGAGERCNLATRSDRKVRAAVLSGLLAGAYPVGGGLGPALRLDHAMITGRLDLEGRTVDPVVSLRWCTFDQTPRLTMARLVGLSLRGCHVPGLRARNLRVASDLVLEPGFTSTGTVDLTDGTVEGTLRLSGAVLRRPGGEALLAARLRVSGSITAVALRAEGEVRLRGANVGGSIYLSGAELRHPDGHALESAGLVVAGNLMCDARGGRFHAAGRVVLSGARIGGDAVLSGARIGGDAVLSGARLDSPVPTARCWSCRTARWTTRSCSTPRGCGWTVT